MADSIPGSTPVVTRFAPSPTGYLHIGGARTALFNWFFARGRGGKFLLRIEDTDRERHTPEAVNAILNGLRWLGVDWDDEPTSQHSRRARHIEVAETLLKTGGAYRCYLTPEELDKAREKARMEKRRFDSPWRNLDANDAPTGKPFVIRFKAPADGITTIHDAVQGDVSFPNEALDDLILLRSDGAPTYNIAVVVDDHDMEVTHVIRGDDHLNNAARQAQIYDALGWTPPVFAHVPLIHGPDGKKLSKRHGALGVEAYRDLGYLAEGLVNYLLRLGWSHGNDEIITRNQAKEWFDLAAINKSPARLDFDKLSHVNGHYISALSDENFIDQIRPFLFSADPNAQEWARIKRGATFLKERCSSLDDIKDAAGFLLLKRPLTIEGKKAKPLHKDGAKELLNEIVAILSDVTIWQSPETLDDVVNAFVLEHGVSFGALGAPMRAATTAGLPAPSLAEVLHSLGPDEALSRLRDQIG